MFIQTINDKNFSTLFVFVNSIDNELKKDRNCLVKIGTETLFHKNYNKNNIVCYVMFSLKKNLKIKVFS